MSERKESDDFGNKVFQQFMDLFIGPEIAKRQKEGKLEKPLDLKAAQIIFFPDGRKPEVRINSEIRARGKMKLKSGITKEAGDLVFEHDLDGIEEIGLLAEEDSDCAHVTLIRFREKWTIVFDFRYNKTLSKAHIETAKQFYKAAEFAFDKKTWAPFIDNLFSAAELIAKANLLSIPDPKLRKKGSHKSIHSKYNRFANLGNAKIVYAKTFNKLAELRYGARYLERDVSISETEASELLKIVRNMINDANNRLQAP